MEVFIDLVSPTEGLMKDLRRCESMLVRPISGSWILCQSWSERVLWIIASFQKSWRGWGVAGGREEKWGKDKDSIFWENSLS